MSAGTPVVVLLSGGMDSTVLLHHVAEDRGAEGIYSVAYDYGQRHRRELDAAEWQARQVGVASHRVVALSAIGSLIAAGTTLIEGAADVPDLAELPEDSLDQPPTYVPNRNMMLLSIAAAYAESIGAREVYYGAQAHDEYGYWDCTEDFLERVNAVFALNRRDAITVRAPFVATGKEALVRRGMELGVDFAQTWSCYRGGAQPCGTCPTCVEREKAFAKAGVSDPLLEGSCE